MGGSGFNGIVGGMEEELEGVGLMELWEGWRRSRREANEWDSGRDGGGGGERVRRVLNGFMGGWKR